MARTATAAKKTAAKTAAQPRKRATKMAAISDLTDLRSLHGIADALARSAQRLGEALDKGGLDDALLANFDLGIGIKAVLDSGCDIPEDVLSTVQRVAGYITAATLAAENGITRGQVLKLIEVQLAVAQTLIEAALRKMVADRAYYRWLEAGCPADTAHDDWLAAERDIAEALGC
ncbi:MAG: DUF2934 domain-containing protein [Actinomycetota bacterium]